MMMDEASISVPGRLCLFGEHSDWAGGYRQQNPALEMGRVIVAQTNQEIQARAKKNKSGSFEIRSTMDGSYSYAKFTLQKDELKSGARSGSLFCYAAGVAYYFMDQFSRRDFQGIEIRNERTTLPVKKGLSSSAAICVLVAKAFNELYGLNLSNFGEMEFAYRGELLTGSQCGRMDQACAFPYPVEMVFDGNFMEAKEIEIGGDFYYLIVDLCSAKDTKKILADLNKSFPFAATERDISVQEYLGKINKNLTERASQALRGGDAATLGAIMNEAQAQFDMHLMPASSALQSPKLHNVLGYGPIQPHIYGGKGVGSQGDGSAQILAKGENKRAKVAEILEQDLGVKCLSLDLKKGLW